MHKFEVSLALKLESGKHKGFCKFGAESPTFSSNSIFIFTELCAWHLGQVYKDTLILIFKYLYKMDAPEALNRSFLGAVLELLLRWSNKQGGGVPALGGLTFQGDRTEQMDSSMQ